MHLRTHGASPPAPTAPRRRGGAELSSSRRLLGSGGSAHCGIHRKYHIGWHEAIKIAEFFRVQRACSAFQRGRLTALPGQPSTVSKRRAAGSARSSMTKPTMTRSRGRHPQPLEMPKRLHKRAAPCRSARAEGWRRRPCCGRRQGRPGPPCWLEWIDSEGEVRPQSGPFRHCDAAGSGSWRRLRAHPRGRSTCPPDPN